MPILLRRIRWREEGASYFFTVVAYHRKRILTKGLCQYLLRAAFAACAISTRKGSAGSSHTSSAVLATLRYVVSFDGIVWTAQFC